MFALSVSLITRLEPGVSYAPRTFSRKIFGCNVTGTRERQCNIFLRVLDGLGAFDHVYAGLSVAGKPRLRDLLVYTGRLAGAVCDGGDWLEFSEYRTNLNQKLAQAIMHYVTTRPPSTWAKVTEDIMGHYGGSHVRPRRVYDVINVLKAVLPHFYTKIMK